MHSNFPGVDGAKGGREGLQEERSLLARARMLRKYSEKLKKTMAILLTRIIISRAHIGNILGIGEE